MAFSITVFLYYVPPFKLGILGWTILKFYHFYTFTIFKKNHLFTKKVAINKFYKKNSFYNLVLSINFFLAIEKFSYSFFSIV